MRRPGEFGVGLSPPPHRAAAPSYAPLHRLGELRDRSYEDQQGRASGLTLLTAAIGLWNAVYLERVEAELRVRGEEVPAEYLALLSPLEWEHISLTGVYRWNLDEKHETPGRMRPLQKLSPTSA
jgi:predicted outer membrane lipoprotein